MTASFWSGRVAFQLVRNAMSDHADSAARTDSGDSGPIPLLGATPFIHLERVCKRYGDLVAVDGVDLSVHPGQVLAIIGPSGSGKSTLLRCINYLERPESGRIAVGDISLDAGTPPSRAELSILRRRVGMVFQSFNLFPHLTVLQNVSLAQRRVLGRSREEAERRSADLLAVVGLADKANQYPSRCSGGQQQRIAIARALALEPSVMLFDEPTSSLDPELGLEVLTVMRKLANAGMTMIIVTHEMHFAEDVSNEVVVMAGGRIVERGPSRELMRNPKQERTRRFLSAVLDR
jgi:polar amino acid transport system ATP-binding protein